MPYTQLKNHWVMSLLERDDPNNPTGAFIQCQKCKNILLKSKHLVGTCQANPEDELCENDSREEQRGSPMSEKMPQKLILRYMYILNPFIVH